MPLKKTVQIAPSSGELYTIDKVLKVEQQKANIKM